MGAVTITSILDEDTMASNSATAIPTQQSVKAYVDNANYVSKSGANAITAKMGMTWAADATNSLTTIIDGQKNTNAQISNVTLNEIICDCGTF
jgi:hypothetical protein